MIGPLSTIFLACYRNAIREASATAILVPARLSAPLSGAPFERPTGTALSCAG